MRGAICAIFIDSRLFAFANAATGPGFWRGVLPLGANSPPLAEQSVILERRSADLKPTKGAECLLLWRKAGLAKTPGFGWMAAGLWPDSRLKIFRAAMLADPQILGGRLNASKLRPARGFLLNAPLMKELPGLSASGCSAI